MLTLNGAMKALDAQNCPACKARELHSLSIGCCTRQHCSTRSSRAASCDVERQGAAWAAYEIEVKAERSLAQKGGWVEKKRERALQSGKWQPSEMKVKVEAGRKADVVGPAPVRTDSEVVCCTLILVLSICLFLFPPPFHPVHSSSVFPLVATFGTRHPLASIGRHERHSYILDPVEDNSFLKVGSGWVPAM